MKKAADASIVFSSDVVAHHGKAYPAAYAAARAGRHSPPD